MELHRPNTLWERIRWLAAECFMRGALAVMPVMQPTDDAGLDLDAALSLYATRRYIERNLPLWSDAERRLDAATAERQDHDATLS